MYYNYYINIIFNLNTLNYGKLRCAGHLKFNNNNYK